MNFWEKNSDGLDVRTYFVRERNALVARADFGGLYVDYYLHLAQFGLRPAPEHDQLFKDTLAAFALHCATRPWNETIAWTINIQEPLLNIFVTGTNIDGSIAGQVFTEEVCRREGNLFCADVVCGNEEPRRSLVDFRGTNIMVAVEHYYVQSEQRPARYFRIDDDDFVLVVGEPDCDLEWLGGLDGNAMKIVDEKEVLSLLEQRRFKWGCGCNQQRMLEVLATSYQGDSEAIFAGEDIVRISCPRCGGRHTITREALEAFVLDSGKQE
jgi:molecular chaperone Hsp33